VLTQIAWKCKVRSHPLTPELIPNIELVVLPAEKKSSVTASLQLSTPHANPEYGGIIQGISGNVLGVAGTSDT
jgi:hypothetical protein